ncbi:DUF1064 domain-containing protein [Herminiimonas sp. CN]|uniref:DUF1064 domain-containing protein n=1 Tax=Herminiimonas sp. CN TaxID=1349818 RepID=UPI00047406FE|nr:DUF1064 domain-containing protein [Herminiimonas sp. CN]
MAAKYRNKKCVHQGMRFDSQAELRRFLALELLQKAGHITELSRQAKFVLAPAVKLGGKTKPAMRYLADFSYRSADGVLIVEDVKSPVTLKTAAYRMKKHLMMHVHGIEIVELK